jgi:hypothetical protein
MHRWPDGHAAKSTVPRAALQSVACRWKPSAGTSTVRPSVRKTHPPENTMTHFAARRFSLVAFVFAAAMTLVVNASVLSGFDQIATNAAQVPTTTQLARAKATKPTVALERVVVTSRRA